MLSGNNQNVPNPENHFEAVNLLDIAPTANLREPSVLIEANSGYYARSLQMLDTGPLKGRLLIAAWDHGLSNSQEQVSILLQEAAKVSQFEILFQYFINILYCRVY